MQQRDLDDGALGAFPCLMLDDSSHVHNVPLLYSPGQAIASPLQLQGTRQWRKREKIQMLV